MSDPIENDSYLNPSLLKQDEIIYPDKSQPKKRESRGIWYWVCIAVAISFGSAMIFSVLISLFMTPY